jgi:hypothetical protein
MRSYELIGGVLLHTRAWVIGVEASGWGLLLPQDAWSNAVSRTSGEHTGAENPGDYEVSILRFRPGLGG